MTDNPLPELPDELTPRAIDLPFEITDEHVELFGRVWHDTPPAEPGDRRRAALTEVVKMVWIEHVLPIEQALEASEAQVAAGGRALYAARKTASDLANAAAALPGAEQREQVARAELGEEA